MSNYIFTSDWHLREDTPPCRTVDFLKIQEYKLEQIEKIRATYEAIIIHAGDMFHKAKPSPFLIRWAIEHMPKNVYAIAGNHDLPYHSKELFTHSGLSVLESSGCVTMLEDNEYHTVNDTTIGIFHKFVYQPKDEEKYAVIKDKVSCASVSKWAKKEYGINFDVVVFGDNHQSFVFEDDNITIVNPGCISVQRTSEFTLHPCVYLCIDDKTTPLTVTQIKLKMYPNSRISEESPEAIKREGMEAFVESLCHEYDVHLSFTDNLKAFVEENTDSIEEQVKQKINKIVWE